MPNLKQLSQSHIFRDLSSAMLDRLFEHGERKVLIEGDVLFRNEQDYTEEIYIVLDGEINIQRTDGQAYVVGAGDFVGLSSFLDQAAYSSTACCQNRADLLVLNENSFNEIKKEYPELSSAVNRSISERIRRWNPGRRGTTGVLIQPVRSFMTVPFASCSAETPLNAALGLMKRRKIGSLGVTDATGRLFGITTPAAIADAIVAKGCDAESLLCDAGVDEAFTIGPDEQLWEAEQMQQDYGVKYLAVVEEGTPIGMVSQTDIVRALCMQAQRNILMGRASEAKSISDLKMLHGKLDECASGALEYNRRAANALRILSDTHLAIMRRCVDLTIAEMARDGREKPAVEFTVLVMGSGGRKEMMLAPDQDNGIILSDDPRVKKADVSAWFSLFAERLIVNLAEIGYARCPGEIMASNPLFCKTLTEWKEQISHLAEFPNEKGARWSNVVFDFDTLYGDDRLTVNLRRHMHEVLSEKKRLLCLMVEDDAEGRPPIGMFKRLITSDEKQSKGRIDIKRNGLRIIADAARVYALSCGITAGNTCDRINALVRLGIIDIDFADSILSAYNELVTLVLDHQLEQHRCGEFPDKLIDPKEITPHMREVLRDAMLAVRRFQLKLQGDFARMNF